MVPKEQRDVIGKEIVDGKISAMDAARKYGISATSARRFATEYKYKNGIPLKSHKAKVKDSDLIKIKRDSSFNLEDYQSMTKEQLIEELIKSKINEARAKKGYEVKGDGRSKEFVSLKDKNSKS